LRSLIQEIDGNNFTNPTILRTTVSDVMCNHLVLIVPQEEYIRGVTEYSASVRNHAPGHCHL
jgi:hypothetical protein